MLLFDHKKVTYRLLNVVLIGAFVFQIVAPTVSFAQSGPSQTETQGTTLNSGGEYIDNFTGDFSYAIPVIDIEGFPLILSYNANVSMTDEASWVGLGWNLNPGSIARQMRGLPDEFDGQDKMQELFTQKKQLKDGSKGGFDIDASVPMPKVPGLTVGASLSMMIGSYYNNYYGFGRTFDLSFGPSIGIDLGNSFIGGGVGVGGSVGFSTDSQNGIGRNGSYSISPYGRLSYLSVNGSFSSSGSVNTRSGKTSKFRSVGVSGSITLASLGTSRGGIRTFGTPTYTPKIQRNSFGGSFSKRDALGLYAGIPILGSASINGAYETYEDSTEMLIGVMNVPAYGYMNLGEGADDESGLMDFNREKERMFSEDMTSLPFANITYDLYMINSPGISSQFRAYRNDVGTLRDPELMNVMTSNSISKANSIGLVYKGAKTKSSGHNLSLSKGNKAVDDLLKFRKKSEFGLGAEEFYFKSVGEKTPTNDHLYNLYGKNRLSYLKQAYNPSDGYFSYLISTSSTPYAFIGAYNQTLPPNNFKNERETRARAINYLYNAELSEFSHEAILDYAEYDEGVNDGSVSKTAVNDSYRKGHHFGKMEVTTENGSIYGYGLPTYNINESQVTFNIEPNEADIDYGKGLTTYQTGVDNTLANDKGIDEYYQKQTTPAYAHSYLLTEVKSSDYSDRTGNGFSADDVGTYLKFNYSRIYGGESSYNWRYPISEKATTESGYPQCVFNTGHNSDLLDDKGFYSYGEKELWYAHSIESKNYILEFYLEEPKDGYPVIGEDGELDLTKPSKALKKIVLFARKDRETNGADAIPLRKVEFEYDYSRCKNYPSNKHTKLGDNYEESGKLTLKSVRMSSGNSSIGDQSPYIFEYEDLNPDFEYNGTDRWGNYKPNVGVQKNDRFPYSIQDEVQANTNIKAWKLKRVINPMGSALEVEYEADRYANIQDRGVMQHFTIAGCSDFKTLISYNVVNIDNFAAHSTLGSGEFRSVDKRKRPYNVVYFKLPEPIIGVDKADAEQKYRETYFNHYEDTPVTDSIYFKTNVKIRPDEPRTEYIEGFAEIKDYVRDEDKEYENDAGTIDALLGTSFQYMPGTGLVGSGSDPYYFGYIILDNDGIKEKLGKGGEWKSKGYPVHPMQKNAMNYIRLNMPRSIYAVCEDNDGNPDVDDCEYSVSFDWKTIFNGNVNRALNKKQFCRTFIPQLSTIRLRAPKKYKFGGNARVKSITFSDNWNEMSGEPTATYKLNYTYDYIDEDGKQMTYGVAAYEPIIGGDENIFYQPRAFNIENLRKPDERHYQIDPVAESIYPAPVVGYSKVQIAFEEIENLTRNSTGYSEFTYKTAKDYPLLATKTPLFIDKQDDVDDELILNRFSVSQGYLVELNDMHGKIESQTVYDGYAEPRLVSKSVYNYCDISHVSPEKAKVIDRNGQVTSEFIGKDYDIYVDKKRYLESIFNLSTSQVLTIKLGIPNYSHSISKINQLRTFDAATFVKVINHSAVVKSVETYYTGQRDESTLLAYDAYTGNPIVYSSQNEFENEIFSYSQPAHWKYPELRSKYKNERFKINDIDIVAGSKINGALGYIEFVKPGDLLFFRTDIGSKFLAYVTSVDEVAGVVYLKDIGGEDIDPQLDLSFVTLKSGLKNRISESMSSYALTSNPLPAADGVVAINTANILQANAMAYTSYSKALCEFLNTCSGSGNKFYDCGEDGFNTNEIAAGFVGNIKPYQNFMYQSERINNNPLNNTNLEKDGKIDDFIPFYELNGSEWVSINEAGHSAYTAADNYGKWRLINEVTDFDRYGNAVESTSQIGVSSSVLYGYNNNFKLFPIASATNATVNQIAYDGFEDYGYLVDEIECENTGHFDFKQSIDASALSKKERHTGNYSLRAFPGQSFSVSRRTQVSLQGQDCESRFAPSSGKYIIGAWIKQENAERLLAYSDLKVNIEFIHSATSTVIYEESFTPSGKIVDGWQRVEGVFDLPLQANNSGYCIQITLTNQSQDIAYFDDLRIHPFKASMTTYVMDDRLLLPMAQLNSYNYATFVMYDENLNAVRVRQETEDGIYTVSETKGGLKK